MMNKVPSIEYYIDPEGEAVCELPCIQACVFYVLRTETDLDPELIFDTFLRDITFSLRENERGVMQDISFIPSSVVDRLFERHYILGKGNQVLPEVEALLDRGKAVIVQTYMQRVPFFKDFFGFDYPFDPEKLKGNYQSEHTFVVVGHDPENLYYAELPYDLNFDRYVSHPDNMTVGVIPKSELSYAFEAFFNYTYLTVHQNAAVDLFDDVKAVIDKIIVNFTRPSEFQNGIMVSYGEEAIERLKNQLFNEQLDLKERVPNYGITVGNLLLWKFRDIASRRKMLRRAFTRYGNRFPEPQAGYMILLLRSVLGGWDTILLELREMCINHEYRPTVSLLKAVTDLAAWENQVVAGLKTLQSNF